MCLSENRRLLLRERVNSSKHHLSWSPSESVQVLYNHVFSNHMPPPKTGLFKIGLRQKYVISEPNVPMIIPFDIQNNKSGFKNVFKIYISYLRDFPFRDKETSFG